MNRGFPWRFQQEGKWFSEAAKALWIEFPALDGQIGEDGKILLTVAQFAVGFYKYELVFITSMLSEEVCWDHKVA